MTAPTPTQAQKAIFGGLTALCGAVATVFADGKVGVVECAIGAAAVIGTVGVVYGVTNQPTA